MKTDQLNKTEKRVLLNLHFLGHMGKSGNMNKDKRLSLLMGLMEKGFINPNCQLTQKAHNHLTNY